ncbi:MAG: hypothetical protein M5U28_52120 [Sandaracinaceae bacterium]|nr:hypothetical protein [Sandaracinaceae bacterium]
MDWVDGRVTSLALDGNTTTYTYEGPFLDVETWEGAVAGSVDRDVDAFGELSAISVDDVGPTPGVTLTYLHDADGRLTAAGDLTVGYTLYGSGTSQHWRRNSALPASGGPLNLDERLNRYGELDYVQLCHGICFSSQTKYTYSVTNRDVAGREVAHTDTVYGEAGGGLFGPSTSGTFTYYYTGTRLWKVTRTVSSSFGSTTTTVAEYTYDANGNRLTATYSGYWADASRPNVATPATYDAQDRLITYGGCSYTYNAAGQLATRTCGAGTDTFEYDLLGNLLSVDLANGNVVEYDVDALGRRIRRRLLDGAAVLEEQRWLYLDGLNPVAELDETNTLRRAFVYGTRANVPDYVIDVGTGARYRIAADPRGTVRAVIDESGAIVQRMRYDAFGFVLEDSRRDRLRPPPVRLRRRHLRPRHRPHPLRRPRLRPGDRAMDRQRPDSLPWSGNESLSLFPRRSDQLRRSRWPRGVGSRSPIVLGGAIVNGLITGLTNGSQVYAGGGRFADGFAAGFIAGFAGGLVGGLVGIWYPVAGGALGGIFTSGLTVLLTATVCGGGDVSWADVGLAAALGGLGGGIFGAAGRAAFNARLPAAAAGIGDELANGFGTFLGETTGSSLSGLTLTLANPGTNYPQPPRGIRGLQR